MSYSDKSKEELIDLAKGQEDKIEELQQLSDEREEEIKMLNGYVDEINESLADREKVSEKAYYAGFKDSNNALTSFKGWLNFKVENRL